MYAVFVCTLYSVQASRHRHHPCSHFPPHFVARNPHFQTFWSGAAVRTREAGRKVIACFSPRESGLEEKSSEEKTASSISCPPVLSRRRVRNHCPMLYSKGRFFPDFFLGFASVHIQSRVRSALLRPMILPQLDIASRALKSILYFQGAAFLSPASPPPWIATSGLTSSRPRCSSRRRPLPPPPPAL